MPYLRGIHLKIGSLKSAVSTDYEAIQDKNELDGPYPFPLWGPPPLAGQY